MDGITRWGGHSDVVTVRIECSCDGLIWFAHEGDSYTSPRAEHRASDGSSPAPALRWRAVVESSVASGAQGVWISLPRRPPPKA